MRLLAPLFIISVLLIPGCWFSNLAVSPASPRPNVMLAEAKTPASLVLAPDIANDFVIPQNASMNAVPVHGWRQTLEAGFHNAFPSGSAGRKLELFSAELTFAPAAVGRGGTAAVVATIRFKARVLDPSGKELAVLAATAVAREANVSPSEAGMTDNASKAVEALYEVLTAELLAKT
jgi:hypothetical protein